MGDHLFMTLLLQGCLDPAAQPGLIPLSASTSDHSLLPSHFTLSVIGQINIIAKETYKTEIIPKIMFLCCIKESTPFLTCKVLHVRRQ